MGHPPGVQGSRGPVFGSVFRTPFFRRRFHMVRKWCLRPSHFQWQTFASFDKASAHVPAARPTRNPLVPGAHCCGTWSCCSRGCVCRERGCHVLAPDCGVARGEAFFHVLMPHPSKKLPFLPKALGGLQGLETESGRGLQWIFAATSNAFCFPFVHCLCRARVELQRRARLLKEELHGDRCILLVQMQQCQRNALAKCILHGVAGARIASTCGFAAPCSA